jgi:predicted nucleotidyltransferase
MSRTQRVKANTPAPNWAELRPEVTEALLAEITQRIVSAFQPEKIVLFGSYASGTANLDSDLDLLVVMESQDSMARRIMRVAEVAEVPFLPMDVLVFTPAEVQERVALRDPFMVDVMAGGRILYQRGPR